MKITKDLLSGLMFMIIGLGATAVATSYSFGTPTRMGPGFFPIIVGSLIGLLGLLVAARAVMNPDSSEEVPLPPIRPVFFVGLAIVLFGFLIESWGLVVALAALIVVARLAGREGGVLELGAMVVVLTILAYVIFIYLLNIRIPVVPW